MIAEIGLMPNSPHDLGAIQNWRDHENKAESISFEDCPEPGDEEAVRIWLGEETENYKKAYREASLLFLRMWDRALSFLLNTPDKTVGVWQLAFATGAAMCEGESIRKKAIELDVTRACLSKGAVAFCEVAELPHSQYMKDEQSHAAYKAARNKQLVPAIVA